MSKRLRLYAGVVIDLWENEALSEHRSQHAMMQLNADDEKPPSCLTLRTLRGCSKTPGRYVGGHFCIE